MHVKKIYRNEAAEGQRFNLTNTSAALSKATGRVTQIGFALRDGLKKKESVGSAAEMWLKDALAEFNGNPSRYEDGYEIEDLIDIIGIDEDELEDYEKELDYVVSGLAKAGFEMI